MLFDYFIKHKITKDEAIIQKILNFLFNNKSSLEKSIAVLGPENLFEFYLYNLFLGWTYILEYNIVEQSNSNIKFYHVAARELISNKLYPTSKKAFNLLFRLRYVQYSEEFDKVQKSNLSANRNFPNIFFTLTFSKPLTVDEFTLEYKNPNFDRFMLMDIYSQHVNYIHSNVKMIMGLRQS